MSFLITSNPLKGHKGVTSEVTNNAIRMFLELNIPMLMSHSLLVIESSGVLEFKNTEILDLKF